MLANETFLSLFFEFLNFAVIIALGYYVFKRMIAPGIKETMAYKQTAQQQLRDDKERLKHEQHLLDMQLVEQQRMAADLRKKIIRWHEDYQREQQEQRFQIEQRKAHLTKKIGIQEYYLTMANLQKAVIPRVITTSRAAAQDHFAAASQGQQFIEKITKHMERVAR